MIEGGNPGGSALAQANQRRATADRLLAEATWLESVAADERTMSAQLCKLPETYTILHDLKVPGSKGNIDHVVIGPGGAFLVITRRHEEGVAFRDGQLFVGAAPMKPDLEAARQEAQLLAQTLGTPVVPVLGLLGAPVPTSVPPAVEGVLISPVEQIDRVVSRNSHTLMPTPKIAETAERALPLLNTPGTTPRVLVAAAARQALVPPVPPMVLAAAPVAVGASATPTPASTKSEKSARQKSQKSEKSAQQKSQKSQKSAQQQQRRRATASTNPVSRYFKDRTGGKKSATFIAASIGSLCLVAFAAGSLVRVLWPSNDAAGGSAGSSTVVQGATVLDTGAVSTTTIFVDAASTVAPPTTVLLVAAVAAPLVNFTPVCSAVGAGWTLVPNWPGDLAGLSAYQVELQNLDGTWQPVTTFATADAVPAAAITGQLPNATLMLQITALLADGTHSPATPTAVITPATAC